MTSHQTNQSRSDDSRAIKVVKSGDPDLIAKVDAGEVAVSKAADGVDKGSGVYS